MKNLIYVTWICFTVVLWSCGSHPKNEYRDKENHRVIEETYSNGQIKSRIVYLNKNKTDYIYTAYYDDGTLMDSARYVNDKAEGKRIYFEENNDLKHEENYSNGQMNGLHKAMYSNGITSYEGFRKNDNKVGEWTFHFPSGAPITYEFYDSTGKLIYFRKYDESGRSVKSNGRSFIFISDKGQIYSPDSASIEMVVIHPPLSNTVLSAQNFSDSDTIRIIGSLAISTERLEFPVQINEPGSYTLRFMLEIQNPDTKEWVHSAEEKTITFSGS